MHWVEVDGVPLPKLYGGHPALDFCNTWSGWDAVVRAPSGPPDPKREWIPTYDRFVIWAGHAGLLPAASGQRLRADATVDARTAGTVLRQAYRFRNALYRLLRDPTDEEAFGEVARVAQAAVRATELAPADGGGARRVLPDSTGLAHPLYAVARAAEELVTGEAVRSVGACPGPDCGWLFLDPRGRRRWCDMASCGNRAKVRAHAARHANE
ncbi:CGNR zinc finger domain-containing protein [Micromonospora sp. NPDC126480]|uniref:CGNR zinc finger domain-containing protein n=1 Tax=Micromonospora sp. NPDC126480 TaxID=3155312 RepID=UPI0033234BDC